MCQLCYGKPMSVGKEKRLWTEHLHVYLAVIPSPPHHISCCPRVKRKYNSISATICDVLHWLPIRQSVDFKLWVTVFNSLHNLVPNYLSNVCQLVAENPSHRHLYSAARGDLAIPATCTIRYGPCSFAVAGPSTWNSLPASLRNCHLPYAFRRELKTELFARAYFY